MVYSLKGRNVLVTGGSRGLGALVCEKFAEEGANLMINYVSAEDKAKEVAGKAQKHGVKVHITKGVRSNGYFGVLPRLTNVRMLEYQKTMFESSTKQSRSSEAWIS